jgi:hypothetical protein
MTSGYGPPMEPGAVIGVIDASQDGGSCLVAGKEASTMGELVFQAGPEGLRCCVVIASATPTPLEPTGDAVT